MNDHNHSQIKLSDGTILYGHKDEYISKVISSTREYYEIHDLRKFSKYIPHDSVIYDIGANIGNHTIFFHKYYKAKKIYSFEPVPMNADLINKNINVNNLFDIEVLRLAAGRRTGKADLSINKQNMGECKLVENSEGSVSVVSIDEMSLDKPDFIKIDVEGFELDVLSGMQQILKYSSPVIWIEINDDFDQVDQFLAEYQYELIDKHNFNHIYVKFENAEKQLQNMHIFKKNIVPEFNQITLDKWNLNNWLSSEKEKVKKIELERTLDKQKFETEKENYSNEIAKLNSNLEELQRKHLSLCKQYDMEKQELYTVISNLNSYLEDQKNKYDRIIKQHETEKQELYSKILHHINMEKKALNDIRSLRQYYQVMESRYVRMKGSLPGKIAVKLWRTIKRFKR